MITLDFDNGGRFNPLGAKPHKMVKHTQTICPQQLTNCFSVFDHFVGLALKGLLFIDLITESKFSVILHIIYSFRKVTAGYYHRICEAEYGSSISSQD